MEEILDRYFSMPQICQYLGVNRLTVLRWIETKNMPAHRVGRNWKFKTTEVDEWVKSGKAADMD
ncbi:MAG: helix-turn-helix domain-containing protein [Clostridia bacterium]|nr:helix-turn-helix domain-containing protein [Clostridia bacterium]